MVLFLQKYVSYDREDRVFDSKRTIMLFHRDITISMLHLHNKKQQISFVCNGYHFDHCYSLIGGDRVCAEERGGDCGQHRRRSRLFAAEAARLVPAAAAAGGDNASGRTRREEESGGGGGAGADDGASGGVARGVLLLRARLERRRHLRQQRPQEVRRLAARAHGLQQRMHLRELRLNRAPTTLALNYDAD